MPSQKALSLDDALGVVVTDKSGQLSLDDALSKVQEIKKDQPHKGMKWTDWLPAVGGAIGGAVGGPVGAVMGGAAGKGYQDLIVHAAELPGAVVDVAKSAWERPLSTVVDVSKGNVAGAAQAAYEGAKQGGMQLIGQGMASGAEAVAVPLMRSALGRSAATLATKPDVAKVALETGTNVTRSSIAALDETIARTTGLADKAALQATRTAVAQAWKNADLTKVATHGGILSTLMIASAKNPAILSAMANGLYHSAGYMAHIAPNALRAAVLALESGKSEKD